MVFLLWKDSVDVQKEFPKRKFYLLSEGMWKRKLEAEAMEAVLFLWKRKRKHENPTTSAST